MAIAFELESLEGYVRITAAGSVDTVGCLQEYMGEMLAAVTEQGADRILVDNRDIRGVVSVAEMGEFTSGLVEQAELLKDARWAIVSSPERLEYVHFIETVARNRGFMVLSFDAVDDAMSWLFD